MLKMKHALILFVLAALLAPALQALAGDSFPMTLNGRTFYISLDTDRETLEQDLKEVLASDAIETFEYGIRFLYFHKEETPITINFEFDSKGKLISAGFDAMTIDENPVAQEIVQWLQDTVGQGVTIDNRTEWKHAGMTFELYDIENSGENTIYGMFVTKTEDAQQSVQNTIDEDGKIVTIIIAVTEPEGTLHIETIDGTFYFSEAVSGSLGSKEYEELFDNLEGFAKNNTPVELELSLSEYGEAVVDITPQDNAGHEELIARAEKAKEVQIEVLECVRPSAVFELEEGNMLTETDKGEFWLGEFTEGPEVFQRVRQFVDTEEQGCLCVKYAVKGSDPDMKILMQVGEMTDNECSW